MTLFPAISPVIERSRQQIQDALLSVRQFLSEELLDEYFGSLDRVQSGDNELNSFIRWILYHYCLHGGFVQARFLYCGQMVFSFGVEVFAWDAEIKVEAVPDRRLGSATEHFAHIRRKQEMRDRVLEIEVILPERIRSVGVNLLDYEIIPIASNYFFYYPALQNTRLVNHVTVLQRFATEIISSHVLREQSVTLTHFRFQDLSVYFERSGEHGTRDFMNGIIRTIRNNLKSTDTVYQMSPTSYVVFSPGAQKHHIQRRFKSIYFQIKSLVLEYKQFIVTIDSLPVNIESLWRELNL